MNSAQPDYYDHPVFIPEDLHFNTPAMDRLNETLHRWIWNGATGGVITGTSRAGKTRAARSLPSQLYTRGGLTIPVYYLSMPKRDKPTILSVFRQLCSSVNVRHTSHDRADNLSERFVHYVSDQAHEIACRQAVLIVDEMQRLIPKQFNAFAEVHDELLLMGINLMCVFVGNDQECSKLIELIEQPKYAHIHGRFFTQGYRFYGLTSKAEVNQCLSQYDKLRYPKKGPTYTEYFLPRAVKKGWKFSSLSSDFWRVFRQYQKNYQIESWGMQFFTATANTLLIDFLPAYGIQHLDDEMIHECIRISGLIPNLVKATQ